MPHSALLCCASPDDSKDLASALEGLHVEVTSVPNCSDALDLAGASQFALILVDLDGDAQWQSTLRALRTRAPWTGVVVYSRLAEERLWLDALDAGAFDFVCKPFRSGEIHWIVENALKAHPAC